MGRRLTVFGRYLQAILVGVVLFAVSFASPITQVVHAQTAAQGLQVSPVVVDLNGEKGGDYTLKLTITNVTPNTLSVESSVNDFVAADDTGNPKVITDTNAPETSYSLRSWVANIPDFNLNPKQSKTLSVAVNVPNNAESGGHYGVIRFSGTPTEASGGQVSLNASVGVLLLARIAGNITEQLAVHDMYAQKGNHRASLLATGPVDIVTMVKNTGNVHVKPIGTLTVKDMFGRTVGSYPFGSNTKNVLPGATRRYDQVVDKRFMFGRYTANVQAAYGTTGGVLLGSTTFWVIPWQLILFILLILAVIIIGGRKMLKAYNRRVIRRAQNTKHRSH